MRSTLFATLLFTTFAPAQDPDGPPSLRIPAFSGYAHPDADAVRRDSDTGAVKECRGELRFYVQFAAKGLFHARLLRRPGATAPIVLMVEEVPAASFVSKEATPSADQTDVEIGKFGLSAGMHMLTLKTADGSPLRGIDALVLTGPAVAGAHTLTVERRNASSVHLAYDAPAEHKDDIEWFAAPSDLCRTMSDLASLSVEAGLEPIGQVLGTNPGLSPEEAKRWTTAWFKGGSEPGVLALVWRLAREGSDRVVVVTASDPGHALVESQAGQRVLTAVLAAAA